MNTQGISSMIFFCYTTGDCFHEGLVDCDSESEYMDQFQKCRDTWNDREK